MDNSYIFSIFLPINNISNNFSQSIKSIINNKFFNFEEEIELILLFNGDTISDNQFKEYVKQYPENIKLIYNNNSSTSLYSDLIKNINGKYISFITEDSILSDLSLIEIFNIFEDNDVDVNFLLNKNLLEKNEYFSNISDEIIGLSKTNACLNLDGVLFFFKKDILCNICEKYEFNDLWTITIKCIDLSGKYAYATNSYFITQYSEYNQDKKYKSEKYYLNKVRYFFEDLMKYFMEKYGELPHYSQEVFLYYLADLIEDFDVNLLNDSQSDDFWNILNTIVSELDFNTVLNYRYIDSRKKNFILYLLDNQRKTYEINENDLDLKVKNHLIDNLNRHKIWIDVIDISDDILNISGLLQSNFPNEHISIKLIHEKNGEKEVFNSTLLDYNQDERKTITYLSINWIYRYNFDFEISIGELINSKLHFDVEFNNEDISFSYKPEIAFRTPASLSTSSIYQTSNDYMLFFKDNSLNIIHNNYPLLLKLELSNIKKIMHDKKEGFKGAIFIRLLYVLLYPIMHKKEIWLFNDRLSFADDNGLCLFDYAVRQGDCIDKYFVISGQSSDYAKLKEKYPNIVKFGCLKHKILYLFADKLIYSFVNEDYSNPYHIGGKLEYKHLFSGLFSFKKYFLQHGITLGDVSNSIKKYNINLSLIVTSSKMEEESFKNSSYGFKDEVIQTLGLPRYDNLSNENIKKQIVFMPSWRSYLNYDESLFKHSKFFKTINDFLNNKDLNDFLGKHGYNLLFKPHPELYKYIDLFSLDNIILTEDSYKKLFNESRMLITDYSSVAFDFAYLKKPVIYYQNTDDYHYQKGYFDFATMGFGEVISDEEELIRRIKEYIENDCIMQKEYEKRVDEFFNYHDKNNCMRVYSWIEEN